MSPGKALVLVLSLLRSYLVRNSLVFQWLGLHALTVRDLGLIPGQGTKLCLVTKKKRSYLVKDLFRAL